MKSSNMIGAAAIAITASTGNAGVKMIAPPVRLLNAEQVKQLCINTKNKSGLIVNGVDACDISIDNGKTWTTLEKYMAAGGVLGVGALGAGAYMIRRRKKSKSEAEDIPGGGGVFEEPGLVPGEMEEAVEVPPEVSEKTEEESLLDAFAADPRVVLEKGAFSKITIAGIGYDISKDWILSTDKPGVWTRGTERIDVSMDGKISYVADSSDMDKNTVDSYMNGTIVTYDGSGVGAILLVSGNTIDGSVDSTGHPNAGAIEKDTSGAVVAHYDDSAVRVEGAPSEESSSTLDAVLGTPEDTETDSGDAIIEDELLADLGSESGLSEGASDTETILPTRTDVSDGEDTKTDEGIIASEKRAGAHVDSTESTEVKDEGKSEPIVTEEKTESIVPAAVKRSFKNGFGLFSRGEKK